MTIRSSSTSLPRIGALFILMQWSPFVLCQAPNVNPPLPVPRLPSMERKSPEGSFVLPPAAEAIPRSTPANGELNISKYVFVGNTKIPTSELESIAAPYLDRPVTGADLEELRQRLTRHYVSKGFINSGVVIRPGALDGRTLTFSVVEGTISQVRLRGLEHLNEGYVVPRLVPDEEAALNVNELGERFQLLLTDPLFSTAQARLIPDAFPGKAILDIDVQRARPYQITLSANNGRTASVGERTIGISAWVRNLTGWGDYLEAGFQRGEPPYRSNQRPSILWAIPVGFWGTELGVYHDSARATVVEEPTRKLQISSRQTTNEVRLSQKIYENLAQKFSMGLVFNERTNQSYLQETPFSFGPGEVDGFTRIRGRRFWQEYSHRWDSQAMVLRSTFLTNRNNLDGGTDTPDRENHIWLGQGHFAKHLGRSNFHFSARGTIQRTDELLPSMDRLAIGGNQSVRGFRENKMIKDEGAILNLDLDYRLWQSTSDQASFSIGLFRDIARGQNRDEKPQRLSSYGLTLKTRFQKAQVDISYALERRMPAKISNSSDSLQDRGVHVQISYAVFD